MATKCYWPTYTIINPDFGNPKSRYQHKKVLQVKLNEKDEKEININIFVWLSKIAIDDTNKAIDNDIGITEQWIKTFAICCDNSNDENIITINDLDKLKKISDALGGKAKIVVDDFKNDSSDGYETLRGGLCTLLDRYFPGLINKFAPKTIREADDYDPKKHKDGRDGVVGAFQLPRYRKIEFEQIILKRNSIYTFTSSVTGKRIKSNFNEYCPCAEFDTIANPEDKQRLYFLSICNDQDKPKDDQPPEVPPPITPVVPEEDPLIPTEEQPDLPVEKLFTIKLPKHTHTDPCSKTSTETTISTNDEQKDYLPFVDTNAFKISLIKSLTGDASTLKDLQSSLAQMRNELSGLNNPNPNNEVADIESEKARLENEIINIENQIKEHETKYANANELQLNLKNSIIKFLKQQKTIKKLSEIITDKSPIEIGIINKYNYLMNTPITDQDGKIIDEPLLLNNKFYKPKASITPPETFKKGNPITYYDKYPKYITIEFLEAKIKEQTGKIPPAIIEFGKNIFIPSVLNTDRIDNYKVIKNVLPNAIMIDLNEFATIEPKSTVIIPLGTISLKIKINIGFKGKFKFKLDCVNANDPKLEQDQCKGIGKLNILDFNGNIIDKFKEIVVDNIVSTKELSIKIPYNIKYTLHEDEDDNIKDPGDILKTRYVKFRFPPTQHLYPGDEDKDKLSTAQTTLNDLNQGVSETMGTPEENSFLNTSVSQFLTSIQIDESIRNKMIDLNPGRPENSKFTIPATLDTIYGWSNRNSPGQGKNGLLKIIFTDNLLKKLNIVKNQIGTSLGIDNNPINDRNNYYEQILIILNNEILNRDCSYARKIRLIIRGDEAIVEIEGNDNYNIYRNMLDDLNQRITNYFFKKNQQNILDINDNKPIRLTNFLELINDPSFVTPNRKIKCSIPVRGTYILDDKTDFADTIIELLYNNNFIVENILDETSAINKDMITNINNILETEIKLPKKLTIKDGDNISVTETSIECCCCKYILDTASDEDLQWTITCEIDK